MSAAHALTAAPEQFPCNLCDRSFPTQQGLSMHLTRTHNAPVSAEAQRQRDRKAAQAAPDATELFERTGRALEVLFPDGIPMSRLIELAELQKQMLKVLGRQ